MGVNVSDTSFLGIDGLHKASKNQDVISLEMGDVSEIRKIENDFVIYTGSPHYIRFIYAINDLDIVQFGKKVRYSEEFKNEGINVNLVEIVDANNLIVNTYERGVEDETLSCGTGATAAALVYGAIENLLFSETEQLNPKESG